MLREAVQIHLRKDNQRMLEEIIEAGYVVVSGNEAEGFKGFFVSASSNTTTAVPLPNTSEEIMAHVKQAAAKKQLPAKTVSAIMIKIG